MVSIILCHVIVTVNTLCYAALATIIATPYTDPGKRVRKKLRTFKKK